MLAADSRLTTADKLPPQSRGPYWPADAAHQAEEAKTQILFLYNTHPPQIPMKPTDAQKLALARIREDREFLANQKWPGYGNGIEKLNTSRAQAGLVRCDGIRWFSLAGTPSDAVKAGRELKKLAAAGLVELHAMRGCRTTHISLTRHGEAIAKP